MHRANFSFDIQKSPAVVRQVIKVLAIGALGTAIVSSLFSHVFGPWTLQQLLSLSAGGFHHLFFWQWISYALVLPRALSLGTVINLLFSLLLIWVAGRAVVERVGSKGFVKLIVVSALAGGVIGSLGLLAFPGSGLI